MNRITEHIILPIKKREKIKFYFNGKSYSAFKNEVISSALIANGINIFSYHHKDKSAQGIYCANGQCSQCTVILNGKAVKACITPITENSRIETLKGLPKITENGKHNFTSVKEIKTEALIIGGGPAGLEAAIELGKYNIKTILIDDKHKLGGKLVLQTHKFFGSVDDCYAGVRGIDIAELLEEKMKKLSSVKVWTNANAVGVYSDKIVGIVRDGVYYLIKPKALLIAAGAREKSLIFKGASLPGVYGAGAFQTIVNRDLVKPCKRLFIVGGGNVGLIAGYHALQAGIKVEGIIEAAPKVGGYKVHADKIKRLGVPIYTSHTVLSANGKNKVKSITVCKVDKNFKPIPNTQRTFKTDTILVAVGLNRCDEFYRQAQNFKMNVYRSGDSEEIAEASAAIFSGKITGRKIAENLGKTTEKIPSAWKQKLNVLKSRPGKTYKNQKIKLNSGISPVFHCCQEIPCNPCVSVCPQKAIKLKTKSIMSLPYFKGKCVGCFKCLTICPGLAVTLVDFRKDEKLPTVFFAYEISEKLLKTNDIVLISDIEGNVLTKTKIEKIINIKTAKTLIISVKMRADLALKAAGVSPVNFEKHIAMCVKMIDLNDDDAIVCRCERVTLGEIKKAVKSGIKDINQLKAVTRISMGACGGKTCIPLIENILKSQGLKSGEITSNIQRPLNMEVELGRFCNTKK